MLKLQLDLCVMSALVLILLGRTMPSSPQVTAQIDKDYHINEMVLVRSRSELDNGEFGMLFGLTCPTFLHGRYSYSQIVFNLEYSTNPID